MLAQQQGEPHQQRLAEKQGFVLPQHHMQTPCTYAGGGGNTGGPPGSQQKPPAGLSCLLSQACRIAFKQSHVPVMLLSRTDEQYNLMTSRLTHHPIICLAFCRLPSIQWPAVRPASRAAVWCGYLGIVAHKLHATAVTV